jgi:hypothetical protein
MLTLVDVFSGVPEVSSTDGDTNTSVNQVSQGSIQILRSYIYEHILTHEHYDALDSLLPFVKVSWNSADMEHNGYPVPIVPIHSHKGFLSEWWEMCLSTIADEGDNEALLDALVYDYLLTNRFKTSAAELLNSLGHSADLSLTVKGHMLPREFLSKWWADGPEAWLSRHKQNIING